MRLAPRFAVAQRKDDNSLKIRAVDDCTFGGLNGCTAAAEKLSPDTVDRLFAASRRGMSVACFRLRPRAHCAPGCSARSAVPSRRSSRSTSTAPTGTLSDAQRRDSATLCGACRRIPLKPHERELSWVAWRASGTTWAARHNALCFGAVAAVHGWDRLGALLCHLVRWLLFVPLLRYVDDKFAPERRGCAEHAMCCVARLVRAVLGHDAVAAKKLEWGENLTILGLQISVCTEGFHASPAAAKRLKWRTRIDGFLASGVLSPGDASKLAGALAWASAAQFHRLGRALLRPLFAQAHGRHPSISTELRFALEWWRHVLDEDLHETRRWAPDPLRHAVLLVDARSTPPRVAAVLILPDGSIRFCDLEPDPAVLSQFRRREDGAILALEILAIALGISTFAPLLHGLSVRVFSDNTGAERATAKGASRQWDYCRVIHSVWHFAAVRKLRIWIERVPTKLNLSDLPSREMYSLLAAIGAVRVPAVLDPCFSRADAWASLQLLGGFCKGHAE